MIVRTWHGCVPLAHAEGFATMNLIRSWLCYFWPSACQRSSSSLFWEKRNTMAELTVPLSSSPLISLTNEVKHHNKIFCRQWTAEDVVLC